MGDPIYKLNYMIVATPLKCTERARGLVSSAFAFRPDDPGWIQCLCAILRFLPHQIWITALNKGGPLMEYNLHGDKPEACWS